MQSTGIHSILTRRSYLWWIAVCAIPPLLKAIGLTWIDYEYEMYSGNRQWIALTGDVLLPAAYYLLLTVALHRALRQFAPKLSLGRWMTAMAASFALYALAFGIGIFPLHLQPTDWDESVRVVTDTVIGHSLPADALGVSGWVNLLHFFAATTLCYVLLPACVMGQVSRIPSHRFFSAGVATIFATFSVSVLIHVIVFGSTLTQSEGCETSPLLPIFNGINDSVAGAIGAAVGCFVLATLLRRDDYSVRLGEAKRLLAWTSLTLTPWMIYWIASLV